MVRTSSRSPTPRRRVASGGSIWPPVVFHGLSNALVNIGLIGKELGETLQSSVVFFLLLIPIAVWAWILARRSERWPANEE